jgi:hypothetical protein
LFLKPLWTRIFNIIVTWELNSTQVFLQVSEQKILIRGQV